MSFDERVCLGWFGWLWGCAARMRRMAIRIQTRLKPLQFPSIKLDAGFEPVSDEQASHLVCGPFSFDVVEPPPDPGPGKDTSRSRSSKSGRTRCREPVR